MKLRPYQENLINKVRESYRRYRSPCIVSPCGSGKSVMIAEIVKSATLKKNRVLFLVHRQELFDQIEETLKWWGADMEYVQLGMVQTIVRRLSKTLAPKIIITDENHHAPAKSYRKIYDHFPDAMLIGFTATPCRLNGGGLGDVNDTLIIGPTVKELIAWGNLAPYKYYAPEIIDTSKLHIRAGEFKAEDVEELFQSKYIWGDVIKHYRKLADGSQAICYCSSIKQSMEMQKAFQEAGIRAEHIDGDTPKELRKEIISKFRTGEVTILTNVDLIGEGFDVPDCSTVILLRPTQSLGLFIQQSMRAMRYKPDKTAIIIDHVGNVGRHGLPDQEREWTLSPDKGANKPKEEAPVKQCPQCFMTVYSNVAKCECGYDFRKAEEEKKQIEAELQEIKEAEARKIVIDTRSIDDLKTVADLYSYAKTHQYKPGWAYHQAKVRGWL